MTDKFSAIIADQISGRWPLEFDPEISQIIIDDFLNSELGRAMGEVNPSAIGEIDECWVYPDSISPTGSLEGTTSSVSEWDVLESCCEVFGEPEIGLSSRSSYPHTSRFERPLDLGFDSSCRCIHFCSVPPSLFECPGEVITPRSSSPGSSIVIPVPSTPRRPFRESGVLIEGEEDENDEEGGELRMVEKRGRAKYWGEMGEDDGDEDGGLKVSPRLLWKREDGKKFVGDDPFL